MMICQPTLRETITGQGMLDVNDRDIEIDITFNRLQWLCLNPSLPALNNSCHGDERSFWYHSNSNLIPQITSDSSNLLEFYMAVRSILTDFSFFIQGVETLYEIELQCPIRYSDKDPVEQWLKTLLCLNVREPLATTEIHPPEHCKLYYVNRDTLFSFQKETEKFLQNLVSMFVASHYKVFEKLIHILCITAKILSDRLFIIILYFVYDFFHEFISIFVTR